MRWRPIETAPLDGTRILATWKGTWEKGGPHIEVVEWVDGEDDGRGYWVYSYDGDGPTEAPSHWMPLPAKPMEGMGGLEALFG
jgi:hypothetical protein